MTDKNSKIGNSETLLPEVFPYPKLIQTFNYFFPKDKGAPDIFTMENLKKISRYAPFLTLGILALITVSWFRDGFAVEREKSVRFGFCMVADSVSFLIIFIQYLWWLGASLLAKIVKRSPVIPLFMSFFDPLRAFGVLCFIHFLGFVFGGLTNLAK